MLLFSGFMSRSPPGAHFTICFCFTASYLPPAPPMREIIKLPMAYRHTGYSPLRGSLRAAPIAMSVAGQEYHDHLCRSWPYREPPDIYSREFTAPRKTDRNCFADHGAAADVACPFLTDGKGNVFDECVFCFQGSDERGCKKSFHLTHFLRGFCTV